MEDLEVADNMGQHRIAWESSQFSLANHFADSYIYSRHPIRCITIAMCRWGLHHPCDLDGSMQLCWCCGHVLTCLNQSCCHHWPSLIHMSRFFKCVTQFWGEYRALPALYTVPRLCREGRGSNFRSMLRRMKTLHTENRRPHMIQPLVHCVMVAGLRSSWQYVFSELPADVQDLFNLSLAKQAHGIGTMLRKKKTHVGSCGNCQSKPCNVWPGLSFGMVCRTYCSRIIQTYPSKQCT